MWKHRSEFLSRRGVEHPEPLVSFASSQLPLALCTKPHPAEVNWYVFYLRYSSATSDFQRQVSQPSNVLPDLSIQRLPSELLLNILQCASNETLAATAHVSRQLRCWSADIFLERTKIIDLHPSSAFVNLKAAVLCHPVLLSLVSTIFQRTKRAIHLECDLFDLVQYHPQVKIAFSLLARFTSIEIRFNRWEMDLLKDARVPSALISALASAESVSQLGISSSFVRPPPRSLGPSIVTAGGAPLQKVEQLMDAMEKVSLSIDFMGTPELRDSCRVFLSSSNLRYLTLNDVTSESLQDSLPFIRLPALTHLRLYSDNDRLILPSHFFQSHTRITHLSVISHSFQHEDTPTAEMLHIQQFPPLVSLSLSSNHYNWVLDPSGPSLLRIQPQDMFPLIIPFDAFCTAVRSLTRPLHMVRVNDYNKTLLIRLPDGIERHVDGQPLSLACCGCGEERIPGISTIELETQSLHASTVVSVIFSIR